jgi:hypothetical protein
MAGVRAIPGNAAGRQMVHAAEVALKGAGQLAYRTAWTPGLRAAGIRKAANGLNELRAALANEPELPFRALPPNAPRPSIGGWVFLGRVLAWRAESEVNSEAVSSLLTAADMCSALRAGDSLLAGLGFSISESTLKPVWRRLPTFTREELMAMYRGVSKSLRKAPPLIDTMAHEHATMRRAVQWTQDAFVNNKVDDLSAVLGAQVSATVRYLKELKGEGQAEQVAFFARFANECDAEAKWQLEQAQIPPFNRAEPPVLEGERPWRRLSLALLRSGRFCLDQAALYDAKMRLFAIDAWLLAQFKAKKAVPTDLAALPKWLRIDPFSGRDFVYAPRGADYRLYSVGPNLIDDGGNSSDAVAEGDITPSR